MNPNEYKLFSLKNHLPNVLSEIILKYDPFPKTTDNWFLLFLNHHNNRLELNGRTKSRLISCCLTPCTKGFIIIFENMSSHYVMNVKELFMTLSKYTLKSKRKNGNQYDQHVGFCKILKHEFLQFKQSWKKQEWNFLKTLRFSKTSNESIVTI
jgi:hypothetical protein